MEQRFIDATKIIQRVRSSLVRPFDAEDRKNPKKSKGKRQIAESKNKDG
jgi:hypothetical protein